MNQESIAIKLVDATSIDLGALFIYLKKASSKHLCKMFHTDQILFTHAYINNTYNYLIYSDNNWRGIVSLNNRSITVSISKFLELDIYNLNKVMKDEQKEKEPTKQLTIFKKYELPTVKRTVTICIMIDQTIVKAGYAVLAPGDKYNEELAQKISFGRAVNDRTNMVEMQCGFGMDKKYIVYAIADNLAKQIDNGKFVIKGIKEDKKSKLKGFISYPEETVDSNVG